MKRWLKRNYPTFVQEDKSLTLSVLIQTRVIAGKVCQKPAAHWIMGLPVTISQLMVFLHVGTTRLDTCAIVQVGLCYPVLTIFTNNYHYGTFFTGNDRKNIVAGHNLFNIFNWDNLVDVCVSCNTWVLHCSQHILSLADWGVPDKRPTSNRCSCSQCLTLGHTLSMSTEALNCHPSKVPKPCSPEA